jgi:uncharacterized protein (TIGR00255 family)
LGRDFSFLESEIQQAVRSVIGRGRVDVSVSVRTDETASVLIDSKVAKAYLEAARKLGDEFSLPETLDLRTLLTLPGVLRDRDVPPSEDDAGSRLSSTLSKGLREALASVLQMRQREGEALEADIIGYLDRIQGKTEQIKALVPGTAVEYRTRLEGRLAQLVPPIVVDPQRIAQEVAILVERSDISEEVARLESHLGQFRQVVEVGKDAGKKLDFLLQEMQREVNTMLSKTGNLEITGLGIAVKADIEKLREQVQNVE